jgi:hypothetical protein
MAATESILTLAIASLTSIRIKEPWRRTGELLTRPGVFGEDRPRWGMAFRYLPIIIVKCHGLLPHVFAAKYEPTLLVNR